MFRVLIAMTLLFTVSAILRASGLPGGWSRADPNSEGVVGATQFAINTKYPGILTHFKIVEAMQQVVAGMKYDIIVDVTFPDSACRVDHYQVWDRFGDRTLTESERMNGKCQ